MANNNDRLKLEPSWKRWLADEFSKAYMLDLRKFLIEEKKAGKTIYPKNDEMFNAFNLTPFNNVKVVILGQDPYHGPNQAHGLCFSVKPDVPSPPSLKNIYKEINNDLGIKPPNHGCLISWAQQGVLLLNSVLTVTRGKAASHQGKGWERLTDTVIRILNDQKEGLVFLLWGSYAQKKGEFIDKSKHLVLQSPHPSPFSADRGFFGNCHFSKTNIYLSDHQTREIDWSIVSV